MQGYLLLILTFGWLTHRFLGWPHFMASLYVELNPWTRWWFIVGAAVAGSVAAFAWGLKQRREYQKAASISLRYGIGGTVSIDKEAINATVAQFVVLLFHGAALKSNLQQQIKLMPGTGQLETT